MNSKSSAKVLYSLLVLLLMIVDSLQSPILEEDKRATHKLMRFGRNPHQLMHFGKRTDVSDVNEDELASVNEISSNELNQQLRNDILNLLYQINQKGSDYPESGYLTTMERRSGAPLALSRKYFFKKAADRDNVFMHFG